LNVKREKCKNVKKVTPLQEGAYRRCKKGHSSSWKEHIGDVKKVTRVNSE
jgi:hypothetical protein